jgi:inosine-uridine nucleoside N-ribohydrolase
VCFALLGACSAVSVDPKPSMSPPRPGTGSIPAGPSTAAPGASVIGSAPTAPARRAILFDTDVAADDLVALAFLLSAPSVELVGITVTGTGEAHCDGGVDIVMRLLDSLDAPPMPVACGREQPLAGSHAFPDAWREHVDQGSGLDLPPSDRDPEASTAVELIQRLAQGHPGLVVLATGPLTNIGEALDAAPALREQIQAIYVMGGALQVPGNLVCCGAPEGNAVAEWNVYVDPHAAQLVVDSGATPRFVSLDGTNQVPVTPAFGAQVRDAATTPAARILADLFSANPFMTDGSYFLWDPLAAQLAAGYPVGTFSPAAVDVEEAEGPESGFTRPVEGDANIEYLATVDAAAAERTLLDVLNGG